MSVGIVIITHGRTGASLIEEARFVLGKELNDLLFLPISQPDELSKSNAKIRSLLQKADAGEGVLVLSDLMGASPANLVSGMLDDYNAVMVTGINLGMLIRICNYRDQSLEQLVQSAVKGGRTAIKIYQP